MIVLGIETSCDETGVALYSQKKSLLGDKIYSQIHMHNKYGGVVPELASRDHVKRLVTLLKDLLKETGVSKKQIDAVAYTKGPGLMGALLVGGCFAKAFAYSMNIPCLGVHHMEGHLLAPMLEPCPPQFPYLALLISGGHTQLMEASGIGSYAILGESLDDAAGEAFDKVAKMLDLDYPGGPQIEKYALNGDPHRFTFPRPMVDRPGLDFSFSGLKTYVLNTVQASRSDHSFNKQMICDIARAFEDAVVDTLTIKCQRALRATKLNKLVIAGGVSANKRLRWALKKMAEKEKSDIFYPRPSFCTDNGAMIAYAGFCRLSKGEVDTDLFLPKPRWSMETLLSEKDNH